ncbi:Endonuclease 8 [Streptomyces griseoloalbus]
MPEGDTVWQAASRLHAALAGKVLTRSDLRVPRFATADLTGRTVLDVTPRGKHILARVEGGLTLHSHLRMDGSWRIYAPRAALERRPGARDPRRLRRRPNARPWATGCPCWS